MNKYFFSRVLILISLLLMATVVRAESLDEEQARYAAAEFFSPSSQSTRLRAKGRQLVLRSDGHERGYYIFDRPEGGIVIVADDDAIGRTVLGYTDKGSFDGEDLPAGLQDWLDQIGVLMDAVHEGKIKRTEVRRKAGKAVVHALICTKWNQRIPYYNMCPLSGATRCLTGCVATAMAQVMKYWEWPKHGYGAVEYHDDGCGQTLNTDLSSSNYDWKNMLDEYSADNYTSTQARAVATLMRDCGYAVRMHYTPNESSASISAHTMQTYFHYSPVAKDRYVNDYPEDMWHDFIRQDLLAKRPVLYSGLGQAGGHEFILDGFDDADYYHVNWGWGGYQDGWFMLTDLNGYNDDQWMINNLVPDYGDDSPFAYTLSPDGILTIEGMGIVPANFQLDTAQEYEQVRKLVLKKGVTGIAENFGNGTKDGEQYNFSNLEELVLPEGLLYIGRRAFMGANKLTSVQLPSTLINMNYAFYACTSLKSLHLPKDLNGFSDYLPNLAELTLDEASPLFSVVDNVLYSKNLKYLTYIPWGVERITIAETTEEILDPYLFYLGTPILSKCMGAPSLHQDILGDPSYFIRDRGYVFVPYGSSGYDEWEKVLRSGWNIMTYTDIGYIPETKITWALDTDMLTISGWGEHAFGEQNAPYYENRNEIQKLVVDEGVLSLYRKGFNGYGNLKDVELPSTLSYIGSYCFSYAAISAITSYAMQAPSLGDGAFMGMPRNGTLYVPVGADYSSWLYALPSGWKIEPFEPEPFATCHIPRNTTTANDFKEWNALLAQRPNTIGVVNPRYTKWAYMTPNMLIQDATNPVGYVCPYFYLTDLTYGYETASRASLTGFSAPASFKAMKGEYKRKLTEGYNTVCLPFAVGEEGLPRNCHMYAYSYFDSENSDAIFVPCTQTEAGHACFVKSTQNVEWQTDLSGMTIAAQPASDAEAGDAWGTFITTANYQSIGYSPRSKDNVFAPLARNLHPFRACFVINTPSAPAEVCIRLGEDDETGIQEVVNIELSNSKCYNLAGQRIANDKQHRGIYIKNGKKVIR